MHLPVFTRSYEVASESAAMLEKAEQIIAAHENLDITKTTADSCYYASKEPQAIVSCGIHWQDVEPSILSKLKLQPGSQLKLYPSAHFNVLRWSLHASISGLILGIAITLVPAFVTVYGTWVTVLESRMGSTQIGAWLVLGVV